MSEHFREEGQSAVPSDDSEMMVLIKKIQQHMVFLERKIDILIGQSSGGSGGGGSFKRKRFSKPFRPDGGHSHSRGQEGHSHSRGRGDYGNRAGSGDRHGDRHFSRDRDGQGQGGQGGYDPRKKSFHRRRDRD